jgi:hypothetical protein
VILKIRVNWFCAIINITFRMTLLFNQPRQCHYNFPLAWRIPLCTQNTVSGPLAGVLDWRKREICFCPLLQPRSSFFLSTDSTPTAINHSHLSLPKQPMATHTRGGARPRRRTHTRPSSPAREADPPAHVAAPSPRCGVRQGGEREHHRPNPRPPLCHLQIVATRNFHTS